MQILQHINASNYQLAYIFSDIFLNKQLLFFIVLGIGMTNIRLETTARLYLSRK
ncbi:hypothetical protein Pse7429DRAFT_1533 [Pseudanabaena biceps PCC 7429]|uniref:Uncharacterized protein n=1 Tax=Pseudanabaena biceps PCC 7429 TaxID=927668 RepID=L8MZA9_9CYAN|nr:hypothetical protein Pse7429DRAFT_1533 [Pseudanabaena biceps PCC 7429]